MEYELRKVGTSGWIVRNSSNVATRVLRLAVIALGMALAVSAGSARAEEDNRTFGEKFMDGFYNTVRGTNMDNRGIDYRERSPLVVPPKLDLPPPTAAAQNTQIANWPKDPDERQRKAVIEAKKKNAPPPARVQAAANQTAAAGPARTRARGLPPASRNQSAAHPAIGAWRAAGRRPLQSERSRRCPRAGIRSPIQFAAGCAR